MHKWVLMGVVVGACLGLGGCLSPATQQLLDDARTNRDSAAAQLAAAEGTGSGDVEALREALARAEATLAAAEELALRERVSEGFEVGGGTLESAAPLLGFLFPPLAQLLGAIGAGLRRVGSAVVRKGGDGQ